LSETVTPQEASDAELWAVLWQAGDLELLLHEGQQELSKAFRSSDHRKYVVCCSRRYGKSYWLCAEALSFALANPGAQIRYAAPTAKMVKKIITPLMRQLLETCPDHLKPSYSQQDGVWAFKNGSEIHVAGCDNNGAERLRGTSTDLALVDEAGFVDDLEYVIQDVLLPQTITTGGRILLASTPPRTPLHAFQTYAAQAEADGAYCHRTIYDAPHISDEMVREYCRETGGEETSTWRREYLAQFVVDEDNAVIPEFTHLEHELVGSEVDWPALPQFADLYVAMDVGYTDLTVALFAWYDFPNAKIRVEDEIVLKRTTSGDIEAAVAQKEKALWGEREIWRRVADAPAIVLADLRKHREASWVLPRKDDKDAAINQLRLDVVNRKVAIHPRCKTLIAHLRGAIWNRSRTSVERSGEFGHFDAVDAMVSLARTVDRNHTPQPRLHGYSKETHWIRPDPDEADLREFGRIKRRRR